MSKIKKSPAKKPAKSSTKKTVKRSSAASKRPRAKRTKTEPSYELFIDDEVIDSIAKKIIRLLGPQMEKTINDAVTSAAYQRQPAPSWPIPAHPMTPTPSEWRLPETICDGGDPSRSIMSPANIIYWKNATTGSPISHDWTRTLPGGVKAVPFANIQCSGLHPCVTKASYSGYFPTDNEGSSANNSTIGLLGTDGQIVQNGDKQVSPFPCLISG
jgi:hypothetical protein